MMVAMAVAGFCIRLTTDGDATMRHVLNQLCISSSLRWDPHRERLQKFVRPQRLGSSQFHHGTKAATKMVKIAHSFLDCSPGGAFDGCVVFGGYNTTVIKISGPGCCYDARCLKLGEGWPFGALFISGFARLCGWFGTSVGTGTPVFGLFSLGGSVAIMKNYIKE